MTTFNSEVEKIMSFAKFKHGLFLKFASFMMKFMGGASYMLFAGEGSSRQLCQYISRNGVRKVLVVTDKPLVELGIVGQVLAGFEGTATEAVIFDAVLPDPTFDIVEQGHAVYQENGCDGILAIGGGSSMDAAKIIGALVTHPGDPRNLVGMNKATNPIPPFFAIPTTSGTGSEATRGAVISDSQTHQKSIIAGANLGPDAACIDPQLLTGLPPHITAATGMDALTHAIEAYISVWDTGDARDKARAAIRIVFEQLPVAYSQGGDIAARDAMAHAAYMAGQAINQVNVGNVHAIAHQLGGEYGVPHGLANAMVLPLVLEMSLPDARARLTELAVLIGKQSAEEFIVAVRELNQQVGIPATCEQLRTEDMAAIRDRAVAEANGYSSPYYMENEACDNVLRQLLAKES
jgi:alcohol dehydrogenase